MVSRKAQKTVEYTTDAGLLGWIQRGVTAAFRTARRIGVVVSKCAHSLRRQSAILLNGDQLTTPRGRRVAIGTGLLAVTTGVTLAFLLEDGGSSVRWLLSVLVSLGWVAARLIVMRLASANQRTPTRSAIEASWGAGLLPYAAAVTSPLYLVAWVGSLVLTRYYLDKVSQPDVDSRRIIWWVAGFELTTATAVWIFGNLSVLLPVS